MAVDWSQYKDLFENLGANQAHWKREWRRTKKIGNLKKRMPSKKKRKRYYKEVLKRN